MSDSRPGIVLIGRNEGERLRRCLESVVGCAGAVVYVDSGSTDGSSDLARAMGADVVTLPAGTPFTAARARNAGLDRLLVLEPGCELVQFVDGDCRVAEGWIETAAAALEAAPDVAVACGRRREAHPEVSVYNRLCDLEWDTPVGEARSCGGDAMMRVGAFREVGGFNPAVIAGEEPELCVRLRARGRRIVRLDAEMTIHDAAVTRFSQWWRRTLRAGHAYAQGAAMHGRSPDRHCVREVRSILFWGGVLPLLAIGGAWSTGGLSIAVLLVLLVVQALRIAAGQRRCGRSARDARAYAAFTVLGKLPQLIGVLKFHLHNLSGQQTTIIEYKAPATPARIGVEAPRP